MIRSFSPVLWRGALIGAVLATTLLAGCGRKGPLEPPPSAQAAPPTNTATQERPPPVMTRSGQPVAPPGEKKRIFLDWLID